MNKYGEEPITFFTSPENKAEIKWIAKEMRKLNGTETIKTLMNKILAMGLSQLKGRGN